MCFGGVASQPGGSRGQVRNNFALPQITVTSPWQGGIPAPPYQADLTVVCEGARKNLQIDFSARDAWLARNSPETHELRTRGVSQVF